MKKARDLLKILILNYYFFIIGRYISRKKMKNKMNVHQTHTFTLQAPKPFTVQRDNPIAVWLEDTTVQSTVQNPTIRITLTQVTSYDYIKKDTLKEQFLRRF